jgi:hypothetical protein
VRNWDYRYTWIRDASFTLYALIRLGLTDESRDFIGWLVRPGGPLDDPDGLHTLYTIEGTSVPAEVELSHFEGYRGSTPVRVGNEARVQLQLDIFGELVDALYLYDKYAEPTSYDLWLRIRGVVDWVAGHWRLPTRGSGRSAPTAASTSTRACSAGSRWTAASASPSSARSRRHSPRGRPSATRSTRACSRTSGTPPSRRSWARGPRRARGGSTRRAC